MDRELEEAAAAKACRPTPHTKCSTVLERQVSGSRTVRGDTCPRPTTGSRSGGGGEEGGGAGGGEGGGGAGVGYPPYEDCTSRRPMPRATLECQGSNVVNSVTRAHAPPPRRWRTRRGSTRCWPPRARRSVQSGKGTPSEKVPYFTAAHTTPRTTLPLNKNK
jgi:hypothetical protein